MNFTTDGRVIIFLFSTGFMLTLLLIIAYEHKHFSKLVTNTFILAKLAQVTGYFFMAFRGTSFDLYSISFGNSLLFLAYFLEVLALLHLKSLINKKETHIYFIFTLLTILGFNFILFFYNIESLRIAYYSIMNAILYFPVYRLIWNKQHTSLMKMVGIVYLLFACGSLYRGIMSLITTDFSTSLYTPGAFQWISVLLIFIFSNTASIGYILLMKEKSDQLLVYYATFDDLTNTLNRRSFNEQKMNCIQACAKSAQPLSYILLDIDHFKTINDTYGHLAGDNVLKQLSKTIQHTLDSHHLFGRYGGDEFGILLPNYDEEASDILIQTMMHELNNLQIDSITFSVSIGVITLIPTSQTSINMLYTCCDHALYKAKKNGRNNVFRGEI